MKQNEKLYDERYRNLSREMMKYKEKNKILQEEISALRIKNKSKKENNESTRNEIENAIKLLEIREQDVENKILQSEVVKRGLYSRIYSLEEELKVTQERLGQVTDMNHQLNQLIEHETVPLSQYHLLQSQYHQLKSFSSQNSHLTSQLESSTLSYEELHKQYLQLQSQYEEIKQTSEHHQQQASEYHKKLSTYRSQIKEYEIKNNLLFERIESYNLELKESHAMQLQTEKRYQQTLYEYNCCNEIRLEQENRLRSQDTELHSLYIVIGNMKQMLKQKSFGKMKQKDGDISRHSDSESCSSGEFKSRGSERTKSNERRSPKKTEIHLEKGFFRESQSLSSSRQSPPFTPLADSLHSVKSPQQTINGTPTKRTFNTFLTQEIDLIDSTPFSGLSSSQRTIFESEEDEPSLMTREMKDQLDQHEQEIKEFRQQLKNLEVNYLHVHSMPHEQPRSESRMDSGG
jgi:hypothetical protein